MSGFFARWGKTKDDDPFFSPFGPELLDIEISTICSRGCSWCYKSNTKNGKNMTFKTFKKILNKIPKILTQIAFGIGDLDGNPDLKKIMRYTRKKGFIPNITINGEKITKEWAKFLAETCGAVAVSHYDDIKCFRAIDMLYEAGLRQINIHKLLAKETYESAIKLVDNFYDKINAIVFLSLKRKGKRNFFNPLGLYDFGHLVHHAIDKQVPIGFDSCSANKFLKVMEDHKDYEKFKMVAEPCESTCFSLYINVDGQIFPCSFIEGEIGYEGIDMLKVKDFLKEVWFCERIKNFRILLENTGRNCPEFEV